MYDKHVIRDQSLRNIIQEGKIVGYAVDALLPYYRGQPLSIVEDITVSVDGVKAERNDVRLSLRGQTWTLDELESLSTTRWEFGEIATVTVIHPGGLKSGAHEVTVAEQLRISYLPWAPVTSCTKQLTIAA